MSGAKEDTDLAEVKAVLWKLQRLDLPDGDGRDSKPKDLNVDGTMPLPVPSADALASIGVFDRKRAAMTKAGSPAQARRGAAVFVLVAGALIAGATLVLYPQLMRVPAQLKTSPAAIEAAGTVQPNQDEAALLSEARRLLSEGDVALARKRLLLGSPGQRADFALLLAQSYDPNYVRTLPRADSLPDRAEAERWYKTWYELAVRGGLAIDSVRLQRIINSMR